MQKIKKKIRRKHFWLFRVQILNNSRERQHYDELQIKIKIFCQQLVVFFRRQRCMYRLWSLLLFYFGHAVNVNGTTVCAASCFLLCLVSLLWFSVLIWLHRSHYRTLITFHFLLRWSLLLFWVYFYFENWQIRGELITRTFH